MKITGRLERDGEEGGISLVSRPLLCGGGVQTGPGGHVTDE